MTYNPLNNCIICIFVLFLFLILRCRLGERTVFWWVDVFLLRLIEFFRSVTLFRLQSQLCAGVAFAIMASAIFVCAVVVCATGADKATD